MQKNVHLFHVWFFFFEYSIFLVLHLSVSVCHVENYYSCRPVSLPRSVDYTSIHRDAASFRLFIIELHVLNSELFLFDL